MAGPDSSGGVTESVLAVGGPVTIAEAERWREAIRAAWSGSGGLRLDLAASGPWDLAGLQVVLSALESARRDGRVLRLSEVPPPLLALVESAGLGGPVRDSIVVS